MNKQNLLGVFAIAIITCLQNSFITGSSEKTTINTTSISTLFENLGQTAQYQWSNTRGKKNWQQHLYYYQKSNLQTPLNKIIPATNALTEIAHVATQCTEAMQIINQIINEPTSKLNSLVKAKRLFIKQSIQRMIEICSNGDPLTEEMASFDIEKYIAHIGSIHNNDLAHTCLIYCLQLSEIYKHGSLQHFVYN